MSHPVHVSGLCRSTPAPRRNPIAPGRAGTHDRAAVIGIPAAARDEVRSAADARGPSGFLQGSDPVPHHGGDRGAAVPPPADLAGARLHRRRRPARTLRARPAGRSPSLCSPLHHRQPGRDRAPRRVRRDLPDVHDRDRAVLGAPADPAAAGLRSRGAAGRLLHAHPGDDPLRAQRAAGRRGDRGDRARALLHRGGAPGPGGAEAAQRPHGAHELRGAAVPGSGGGAGPVRHRGARPRRRRRQGLGARHGAGTGRGRPGSDRDRRPPRPAAAVPARGAHALDRTVHGGLPAGDRRHGADRSRRAACR
jgi:hypothetical protein